MLIDMKTNAIALLLKLVLSSVVLLSLALNASQAAEISQNSSREQPSTQDRASWQALDWLMYMQTASLEQNYQGRFVFSRGPMSSAMSIIHQYSDGVEKERLKQLDGEMGEIVRDGERVMCVFPDNRVVEVESSPISHNFTNKFVGFMPGKSQYALSVVGKDRMIESSLVLLPMMMIVIAISYGLTSSKVFC